MIGLEEQFARQILELAAYTGWRCYRVEDSTRVITRRSGARVRIRNVNPQGVGFPDLVLVRRGRLIFAELKADGRYPETAQREWLGALGTVQDRLSVVAPNLDAVTVVVWRPKDWPEIERLLTGAEERVA